MAAPGASGPGSGSTPRKFSEKIALQRQRQAEETAAFEKVMNDLTSTRLQAQKLRMAHMRGSYYGGSLPNVNQIGSGSTEFQGPSQSPMDQSRNTRHHGLVERVTRDPRRMMSPLRRYMRQMDSSPYSTSYLSPHQESSWRRNAPWGNYPSDTGQLFRLQSSLNRTNSDSALHTSVMNPSGHESYPAQSQGVPMQRTAFPFCVPAIEESHVDNSNLLKPCDVKKMNAASSRPKSCEVPGINIYPSAEQQVSVPPVVSVLNTGGSLPDLTNLHFPSPLPTPLDPDDSGFCNLSGGNSTGNLTSTMTHLDIGRVGLPPTFDSSGFSSTVQNSLSRQSLQSSLSNPNIQSSLSNPSLQTSFSHPSLPSSLSNQSLASSLSNQSLSPSASSHSLPSGYSTPSSPSSSSSSSFPPLVTSPRRRVPLSPLTLPMGVDSRRTHQKQFSPTSPTLTSITQGVPLDTSSMDQRLTHYLFNHSNLMHQSQQPGNQSQQPSINQPQQSFSQSQSPLGQTQQPANQSLHQQPLPDFTQKPYHSTIHKGHQGLSSNAQHFPYQQNSGGLPYQHLLGEYTLGNSLLSSLFDECDLQFSAPQSQQFEQCNMDSGHLALSGEYLPTHTPGGGGNTTYQPQTFKKQNNSNCGRHDPIPNIILTAVDSPPGFSKEITTALSCVPGFEVDQSLGLEADLNIEPLTLDGLNMLSDPYAPLTDPLVEDSFRCDRLQ